MISSKFTKKAMVHVSGTQTIGSVCDGREGQELKIIAKRLQSTLNLTCEEIDDYYDAFQMFPLDSSHRISASSIQIFYENSDINLSHSEAMNALYAFLGGGTGGTTAAAAGAGAGVGRGGNHHSLQGINSIDFEMFVIHLEKWMKKEIHHPEVLKMACTIYDEDGPNVESLQHLLVNIDGPQLSQKQLSLLAETMNDLGT